MMLYAICKVLLTGEYGSEDVNMFLTGLGILGIRRAIKEKI